MAKQVKHYKVFIASPRGFDAEREAFKKLINEYNIYEALPKEMCFEAIGWDILAPTATQPQERINELIRECDYFVLLLHDKWGASTPTNKKYYSGSHEEIHVASECCGDKKLPMKDAVIFFKSIPDAQLSDPGDELKKVIEFRREREKEGDVFFSTYDIPETFVSKLRHTLASWKFEHEKRKPKEVKFLLRTTTADKSKQVISMDFDSTNIEINEGLKKARELFKEGKRLEAEYLCAHLIINYDMPTAMIEYARFARKMGNIQKASDLLDKALKKTEMLKDYENKAYALQQKGKIDEVLGNNEQAKVSYELALDIYNSKVDNKKCEAITLSYLGTIFRRQNQYEESKDKLNQALNIFKSLNDSRGIIHVSSYLGVLSKQKGDLKSAEQYYNMALEYVVDNEYLEAEISSNLGVIYRMNGEAAKAEAIHKRCLKIFEKAESYEEQIREHGNLGEVEEMQKKYEAAYNHYKVALSLAEKINKKDSMGIGLSQMGKVKFKMKEYKESELLLLRALDIAVEMNDRYSQSLRLKSLGVLYRLKGDNSKSINYLEQALKQSLYIKNDGAIANTNLELAYTYFQLSQRDKALDCAENAKTFFKNVGMKAKEKEADELINKLRFS